MINSRKAFFLWGLLVGIVMVVIIVMTVVTGDADKATDIIPTIFLIITALSLWAADVEDKK
jgi:uncharacterized membrane protein YhaH (DUF805 family)